MKKIVSYLLIVSMLFSLVGTGVCNVAKEEAKAEETDTKEIEKVYYNKSAYYVFPSGTVTTWTEAVEYCESLGGHLATIGSKEENDFLYGYISEQGYESAYFGYTDKTKEGTWLWVTDNDIEYTNWHSGEDNNSGGNEDYAMFYYKFTDGTWNDGSFNAGNTVKDTTVFICEWDNAVCVDKHISYSDTNNELEYPIYTKESFSKQLEQWVVNGPYSEMFAESLNGKTYDELLDMSINMPVMADDNTAYLIEGEATVKDVMAYIIFADKANKYIDKAIRNTEEMILDGKATDAYKGFLKTVKNFQTQYFYFQADLNGKDLFNQTLQTLIMAKSAITLVDFIEDSSKTKISYKYLTDMYKASVYKETPKYYDDLKYFICSGGDTKYLNSAYSNTLNGYTALFNDINMVYKIVRKDDIEKNKIVEIGLDNLTYFADKHNLKVSSKIKQIKTTWKNTNTVLKLISAMANGTLFGTMSSAWKLSNTYIDNVKKLYDDVASIDAGWYALTYYYLSVNNMGLLKAMIDENTGNAEFKIDRFVSYGFPVDETDVIEKSIAYYYEDKAYLNYAYTPNNEMRYYLWNACETMASINDIDSEEYINMLLEYILAELNYSVNSNDSYGIDIYFKLPEGTTAQDWGVNIWGNNIVRIIGAEDRVQAPLTWGDKSFPGMISLDDTMKEFAKVRVELSTEDSCIYGVQFFNPNTGDAGTTYSNWNETIMSKNQLQVYYNTKDGYWYTDANMTEKIVTDEMHEDLFYDDSVNFVIEDGVLTKYNGCQNYVKIPDTVTAIGDAAFKGVGDIMHIEIPETVKSIGASAFYECKNLRDMSIPNSVESIGDYAFYNCENMTEIKLPENKMFTAIPSYMCYECGALTKVGIPDGVTTIGIAAFIRCTALEEVELPDSVTTIEEHVFAGCKALKEVELPNSIESIGFDAFRNCISITEVEIPKSLDRCGVYGDYGGVFKGCSNLKTVIFEKGTTQIAEGLFSSCDGIENIEIPDTVTEIEYAAFYNCTNLRELMIPDSVTTIGDSAFQGCTALEGVELPDSVTTIEEYAFQDCTSLTSVNMKDGVEDLSIYAFYGCEELVEIILHESVERIGAKAFGNCNNLEKIVIPDSVTWMGTGVFYEDIALKNVDLGNGITSIPANTFYGCTSLPSITIPDSVTIIGDSSFENCAKLTDVVIPLNTKSIASNAFSCSKRLTISGYTSSYAEEYATANDIPFVSIGIVPESIESATISVLGNDIYYDGIPKEPAIEVLLNNELVPADGYTVSYTDNTALGTGYVTITGIEDNGYIGSTTKEFEIKLAAPELFSITETKEGVLVKWNSVYGAESYKIYRKVIDGEYCEVGSVETNSFVDSYAEPNTSYTYTICACSSNFVSEYDETGITITTAKDTYIVKFNANGGSVSTASKSVKNKTVIGTLPTPTRTGYTFTGWYTAKSGGTKIATTTAITKDMTLYARWTINKYTVKFNANGGTVGYDSKKITYNTAVGTLPTPKRTGYTFKGWYTAKSGGTKVYTTTKITKGMTLYAKWTANKYTVKFNANGGKVSTTSKKVTYKTKIGTLPTPKRTGYTFKGWYTAKSGGTKITSSTKITKKMTLYARWSKNKYTVKFNANGGKVSTTSRKVYYGAKVGTLPTPKRTGYTFKGWYTSKTGGSKVSKSKVIKKNTVIYARWTKK